MKWFHHLGITAPLVYVTAGVAWTAYSASRGAAGKATWDPTGSPAASIAANVFAWPIGVVQTIRLSRQTTT